MSTLLYAHWVNCIKDNCPVSYKGGCGEGTGRDYPADGKCRYSDYYPISEIFEKLGAYETVEQYKEAMRR